MAKKAKDTTAQDTAVADPTNSTEPTPNSSPLDEAQANPNAATGDESDNTNTDTDNETENPELNEAPAPDDVNDPEAQQSQPEQPTQPDVAANPDTEATLTAANGPSEAVPAGSADATADATADGQHNETENTHPQSRLHQVEVELTDEDRLAIHEESNQDGAVVAVIAEKWGVTPEQVTAIVDDVNANADRSGQAEDDE